jgi:drug/metabolite transporter (DMT)-like permease
VSWGAYNFGQSKVPEGLSNVIAIAAGGSSSVAIVFMSAPTSPLPLRGIWIFVVLGVILIISIGCFWFLVRRTNKQR